MKTICYNSKLAKLILFGCYTTIMFFGFILTRLKELSFQVVRIVLVEFGFHFKCARTVSVFIDLSIPNLVVCEQVIHEAYKPFCQIKNVVE